MVLGVATVVGSHGAGEAQPEAQASRSPVRTYVHELSSTVHPSIVSRAWSPGFPSLGTGRARRISSAAGMAGRGLPPSKRGPPTTAAAPASGGAGRGAPPTSSNMLGAAARATPNAAVAAGVGRDTTSSQTNTTTATGAVGRPAQGVVVDGVLHLLPGRWQRDR